MRTKQVFPVVVRFAAIFFPFIVPENLTAQAVELPYYTGFDNLTEQSGWQQYRQGYESVQEWSFGSGLAPVGYSLPTCLFHDYNVGGDDTQTVVDWFVSPAIHFSSESKLELKIRVSGFSNPLEDNLMICFGTLSQDPALGSFALLANLSEMSPNQIWLDTIIDIPYTADEGYIGIRYKTVGSNWKSYALDNFNITINPLLIKEGDVDSEMEVQVFPNPFDNQLNVQTLNEIEGIEVLDVNGRCVLSEMKRGSNVRLNTSDFAMGVYLLRLITDKGVQTTRIVK